MTNAMAALKKEGVQCMVAPYGERVCAHVRTYVYLCVPPPCVKGIYCTYRTARVGGVPGHCQPRPRMSKAVFRAVLSVASRPFSL